MKGGKPVATHTISSSPVNRPAKPCLSKVFVWLYKVQQTSFLSACISSFLACRTVEWARRASFTCLAKGDVHNRWEICEIITLWLGVFLHNISTKRVFWGPVSPKLTNTGRCVRLCACTCDCWISLCRDKGCVCVLSRMLSSPRFRAFCCRERFTVRNSNVNPCSCSIYGTDTHTQAHTKIHSFKLVVLLSLMNKSSFCRKHDSFHATVHLWQQSALGLYLGFFLPQFRLEHWQPVSQPLSLDAEPVAVRLWGF